MITNFIIISFLPFPPAAILVGILLDRLWGQSPVQHESPLQNKERLITALALFSPLPLVLGIGGFGVVFEESFPKKFLQLSVKIGF